MLNQPRTIGGPIGGIYLDLQDNQVLVGPSDQANATMAQLQAKIEGAVNAMDWGQLKQWINMVMQRASAEAAPVARDLLNEAEAQGFTPSQGFAYLKQGLEKRDIKIPESHEFMQAASDAAAKLVGHGLLQAKQAGWTLPAIIAVFLLYLYVRR